MARLTARDLTFRYHADSDIILDHLTLNISDGAITALTGPSGAGKSTLLYLLALMLRQYEGDIEVNNQSTRFMSDAEVTRLRAQHMGFVFQDALLDPRRTVRDNVTDSGVFAGMPAKERRHRAHELLDQFGVGHRAHHRPGEISGGQAQRVALCRALLTRPTLIFGDEPTGNLDPESAQVVWGALKEAAAQGATVIVATHDPALAHDADERVVLT